MTDKQTYLFLVKSGKRVESFTEFVEPTTLRQLIDADENYRMADQLSIYMLDADTLGLELVYDSSKRLPSFVYKDIRTLRDLYQINPANGHKEQIQKWMYEFGGEQDTKGVKWLKSILSAQGFVLANPCRLAKCFKFSEALNLELIPLDGWDAQKQVRDLPVKVNGNIRVYEKIMTLNSESIAQYQQITDPAVAKSQAYACLFDTTYGFHGACIEMQDGDVHAYLLHSEDKGHSWKTIEELEVREELLGDYWFMVEKDFLTLQFNVIVTS